MRTPTKNYTDAKITELKGQIQASVYAKDVQKELKRRKIERSLSYIIQVVNGTFYNEEVWDAVVRVLAKREKAKEAKSKQVDAALEMA